MKLEEQVCGLGLAKRLKELGVRQESYFYWNDTNHDYYEIEGGFGAGDYSAFSVAELGEMLPNKIEDNWKLKVNHGGDLWNTFYAAKNHKLGSKFIHETSDEYLANSFAKMLIYLLENKLYLTE